MLAFEYTNLLVTTTDASPPMTLNMTFADIVVSFIVGIIGSVLIVLFNEKIVGLQRKLADWWAQRSAKAVSRRIQKINTQIGRLNLIISDPIYRSKEVERAKFKANTCGIGVIMHFTMLIFMRHIIRSITDGDVSKYLSAQEKGFAYYSLNVASFFAVIFAASAILNFFVALSGKADLEEIIDAEKRLDLLSASAIKLKMRHHKINMS